jgi:hypothetical protein
MWSVGKGVAMENRMLEAVKEYPFLKEIEERKAILLNNGLFRTVELIDILLEALAQESSGMYTAGFHCMEEALRNADLYIKEENKNDNERSITKQYEDYR